MRLKIKAALIGEACAIPATIRSEMMPGSMVPIRTGVQPISRSRKRCRVSATASHSATAASANRRKTISPIAAASTIALSPTMLEDHRLMARNMASMATVVVGMIARFAATPSRPGRESAQCSRNRGSPKAPATSDVAAASAIR